MGFDSPVGLDAASESGHWRYLSSSFDWRHCFLDDSALGRDYQSRIHKPGAVCLAFSLFPRNREKSNWNGFDFDFLLRLGIWKDEAVVKSMCRHGDHRL